MAFLKIENVAIRGVSACVPSKVEENKDLPFYAHGEAEQVIEAIGIERRHVAGSDITVADLCLKSAKKLIEELDWEKESIGLIALVTQNPDYINHPTSFVVHEKLGLPESTICMDFFHGCPGWVVGLSNIMAMVSTGNVKRALLLDGDTTSKDQEALSREERPLNGDAGTAVALEYSKNAPMCFFNIGTQSEDGIALAKSIGGYKKPYTLETLKARLDRLAGVLPPDMTVDHMDSMDVFSFAITKVPKAIKKLCSEFEICIDDIDKLLLHQANKMIVEAIAKRTKVPMEKVPSSLKNFGNTTSASIPLTLVTECADLYKNNKVKSVAAAFGTGLAWGTAYFETDNLVIPNLIVL